MATLDIKTPEHLMDMLASLQLTSAKQKQLNKELASDTRNFFRGQIKKQSDINGTSYAPRKRRAERERIGMKKVNRNMLTGLSRMLMPQSDENGFSVGIAGVAGKIAKKHNEGQAISYTTRMNGWFNSKTNRWEGGIKRKAAYRMPKRTFIGWTPKLEQQIAHKIMQHMEPK